MPAKKSAKTTHTHLGHRLSWKWVMLSLAGVSGVYVTLVATGHGQAIAGKEVLFCPTQKQVCTGGNCDSAPACKDGKCGPSCPGNCGKKAA